MAAFKRKWQDDIGITTQALVVKYTFPPKKFRNSFSSNIET